MSMNYGNLLKEYRTAKSVSQRMLAERSGVSRRSIEFWELGERGMTLTNAEKVFGALGYRIEIVPEQEEE